MKKLSALLCIFLLPNLVLAQFLTDGNKLYDPEINANNQPMMEGQNDQLNMGSDQQLRDMNGFTNTTSGARNNGESSQGKSNATQILGLIMGAAFMSQCGPKNPAACVMGAMSFMDAAASGRNKSNSNTFQNQLLPGSGGGDSLTGNESADSQANQGLSKLSELGYEVGPDGSVTTPEGDTFTPGDFGSVQSLVDKGYSQGQAENALDMYKQVAEDAQKQVALNMKNPTKGSFAVDPDDGAGGGVTIIDEGPESVSGKAKKSSSTAGLKGSRLPASELAGLKKNFNGEPIGIGLANIFLIVNKKYKKEDKEKAFIKKEY